MSDHEIDHDDPLQIHEQVQVGGNIPVPEEIEERLHEEGGDRDADDELDG